MFDEDYSNIILFGGFYLGLDEKYKLTLSVLNETLAVCRLKNDEKIPLWVISDNAFFSITKTNDELSIVCLEDSVPKETVAEKGFRCFKIEGPLDFSLIGVLAPIANLLAENKISIFVVSTYDTDYILVRQENLNEAIVTLRKVGYIILE